MFSEKQGWGGGVVSWIQMPWDVLHLWGWLVVAQAYVRSWRKSVVSSAQPLSVGYSDAWFITPA